MLTLFPMGQLQDKEWEHIRGTIKGEKQWVKRTNNTTDLRKLILGDTIEFVKSMGIRMWVTSNTRNGLTKKEKKKEKYPSSFSLFWIQ